jgi:uncharacterized protein with GYD domain
MPKYLVTASYTSEGTKGVLHEGGSGRKAAIQKAVQGLGGTVEAMYYAFGDTDVLLIIDMPDMVSGLALSLQANASGTVNVKTTPLITIEEIDKACKKSVAYRAAGA